jgi:4-hydroxy-tetrahydrodipicolinate reductase
MIRVAITGTGQMARLVLATVEAQPDFDPVGMVEPMGAASNEFRGDSGAVYPLTDDPEALFASVHPDVVVDFTNAAFTARLVEASLAHGVRPVIGTSGVDPATVERLRAGSAAAGRGAVVAANFAIGAVLEMHMATIAARFFDSAEIIELHHDRKVDAPSGTALSTAQMMRAARGRDFNANVPDLKHIEDTRGGAVGGIPIHSIRLSGFVASQEVIFGGTGQTLTIRHDSTGRESFMPGVVMAVREVMQRDTLVEGLASLVGLG